ncbi:hypothetical protein, conserved in T. vivax, (fragment) [Trypanosoma vivax Y486]|uniref:Uncharacterized protein n=1 Tax=Trypanosoma vivax (strain Y486) TaxID=1055687 RepID=F9WL33_TRYVY
MNITKHTTPSPPCCSRPARAQGDASLRENRPVSALAFLFAKRVPDRSTVRRPTGLAPLPPLRPVDTHVLPLTLPVPSFLSFSPEHRPRRWFHWHRAHRPKCFVPTTLRVDIGPGRSLSVRGSRAQSASHAPGPSLARCSVRSSSITFPSSSATPPRFFRAVPPACCGRNSCAVLPIPRSPPRGPSRHQCNGTVQHVRFAPATHACATPLVAALSPPPVDRTRHRSGRAPARRAQRATEHLPTPEDGLSQAVLARLSGPLPIRTSALSEGTRGRRR